MTETKDLPGDEKYLIFQALSHPARVKILSLLASNNNLTFSALKHGLGMESSGQLQHHLQKLSGLIADGGEEGGGRIGSYYLTSIGRRALEIYSQSEKSGAPLADICCLPVASELARYTRIGKTGVLLRFSIGSLLTALTAAIIANYIFPNHAYLKAFDVFGGGTTSWSWIPDAIVLGFFGVSFLISSVTKYPGCEITAIPNLFAQNKRYCSCLITPFNVPNGRLLQRGNTRYREKRSF